MRKILVISLSLLTLLLVVSPVFAAQFLRPAENDEGQVTVSGTDVSNAYVVGGNVVVDANARGDLFAIGGMVTVNGSVEKDLVAAGGNLFLNGAVGEDVRVAGGNVNVNAPVGGDLLAAGGNVTVGSKTAVGADLSVAGGNIVIDSPVKGNVTITGGNVTINSKLEGNVEVTADKLIFGSTSVVLGKIKYEGPKEAVVKEGAKVSTIEFNQVAKKSYGKELAGLFTVALLINLLAALIVGLVLLKLFKPKIQTLIESGFSDFWMNLGLGIVWLIVVPVITIILFVTFVGYYLALIVMLAYILSLLIACALSMFFAGSLLWHWFSGKKEVMAVDWRTLVIGLFALEIIQWIPFIGWVAYFALVLTMFGALLRNLYAKHGLKKTETVLPPVLMA